MEKINYIVEDEGVGLRIDAYIALVSELSRSNIQRLIENGDVLLNGETTKAKIKVKEGDMIELQYEEAVPVDIKPIKMDLDIIYEDEDLIVINKPKGLVVHPGPGNYDYTLVHGLLEHCHDLSGINGIMRPGIVHRIDKDTSGLLVCAKNDKAHISLSEQLQTKTCFRKYYALAWGVFEHDSGMIDAPIGRDSKDRQKMAVTEKNSKEAITLFKVLERFDDSTLVECELKTGRTHQIRVHLKYINHPIVNDTRYSNRKKIDDSGQYLHAYYLSFVHPSTNERMEFVTDMPAYMQEYIKNKKEGNYEQL